MRRCILFFAVLLSAIIALQAQQMVVKDSDTNVLMQVNDEGSVGSITLPSGSAPSVTTNKMYNISGALYWNGNALGTAGSAGGWTDGGTSVYTTNSTDRVGIGTSSPEFRLSIDNDGGIIAKGIYSSGESLGTSGAGTRLIWYPRKSAFRAGYVDGSQWDDTNTGIYSTAFGYGTTAAGQRSTAMGTGTTANGNYSTAMGSATTASGTIATAMGYATTAGSYASVAMGRYNVGGGTIGSWVNTDPLFELGNGANTSSRSNALTVLKNGNVGVGTASPNLFLWSHLERVFSLKSPNTDGYGVIEIAGNDISGNGGAVLALGSGTTHFSEIRAEKAGTDGGNLQFRTKADAGSFDTRLFLTDDGHIGIGTTSPEFKLSLDNDGGILAKGTYDEGSALSASGAGTRLIWYPAKAAFRAGYVNGDQWDDTNIGTFSTAIGGSIEASGMASTALGGNTTASGEGATALGYGTNANGDGSTATGLSTTANGDGSTAMGISTTADAFISMAIGRFNVGGGTADTWEDEDPLFEIGFGSNASNKENALTVLKNGKVGIGTAIPASLLEVSQGDIRVTDGSFIADGTTLNVPDYVFETDYPLESIEEHAAYMWMHKHLPALASADEMQNAEKGYDISERREQILEELEKAHIYIEQLHKRIEEQHVQIEMLEDKIK